MTSSLDPLVVYVATSLGVAPCTVCLTPIASDARRVTVFEEAEMKTFARICVSCAIASFDPEIRKAGYAAAARTSS